MTVQNRTNVKIKDQPNSTGFIYGSLDTRRAAGLRGVQVYFPLPYGGERRSTYDIDELEEIETE